MIYKCQKSVTDFLIFFDKIFLSKKIGGEEGMTQKEYQQACEIERLKKENRELNNKNKDLENGKKTLKSKLKIANDYAEDLKKENKIKDYEELERKYNISKDEIRSLNKEISNKDSIIQALKARLNKNYLIFYNNKII